MPLAGICVASFVAVLVVLRRAGAILALVARQGRVQIREEMTSEAMIANGVLQAMPTFAALLMVIATTIERSQ